MTATNQSLVLDRTPIRNVLIFLSLEEAARLDQHYRYLKKCYKEKGGIKPTRRDLLRAFVLSGLDAAERRRFATKRK